MILIYGGTMIIISLGQLVRSLSDLHPSHHHHHHHHQPRNSKDLPPRPAPVSRFPLVHPQPIYVLGIVINVYQREKCQKKKSPIILLIKKKCSLPVNFPLLFLLKPSFLWLPTRYLLACILYSPKTHYHFTKNIYIKQHRARFVRAYAH